MPPLYTLGFALQLLQAELQFSPAHRYPSAHPAFFKRLAQHVCYDSVSRYVENFICPVQKRYSGDRSTRRLVVLRRYYRVRRLGLVLTRQPHKWQLVVTIWSVHGNEHRLEEVLNPRSEQRYSTRELSNKWKTYGPEDICWTVSRVYQCTALRVGLLVQERHGRTGNDHWCASLPAEREVDFNLGLAVIFWDRKWVILQRIRDFVSQKKVVSELVDRFVWELRCARPFMQLVLVFDWTLGKCSEVLACIEDKNCTLFLAAGGDRSQINRTETSPACATDVVQSYPQHLNRPIFGIDIVRCEDWNLLRELDGPARPSADGQPARVNPIKSR